MAGSHTPDLLMDVTTPGGHRADSWGGSEQEGHFLTRLRAQGSLSPPQSSLLNTRGLLSAWLPRSVAGHDCALSGSVPLGSSRSVAEGGLASKGTPTRWDVPWGWGSVGKGSLFCP